MGAAMELKANARSSPDRWQEDALFAHFTRGLARRQRRPREYPAPPASTISDALEQLCGGVLSPITSFPDDVSVTDLEEPATLEE
jgi:hypothetical protein